MVVQLASLRLDALEDHLRLLARAHEDDALDRIVRLVEPELPEPRRVADLDLRDVLHEDRDAVLHREHDVADVLERDDASETAHVEELAALRVEPAAGVAVVRAERVGDVADRQTGAGELRRIDEHLVLHRLAAERRDVGDARHRAIRLVEHPVLEDVQVHRRAVGALDHVAVHESRR